MSQNLLNRIALVVVCVAGIMVVGAALSSQLFQSSPPPAETDTLQSLANELPQPVNQAANPKAPPTAIHTPGDSGQPQATVPIKPQPAIPPKAPAINPKLIQLDKEIEERAPLLQEASDTAKAFYSNPNTETAEAIQKLVDKLRQPEFLTSRGGVPLEQFYRFVCNPGREAGKKVPAATWQKLVTFFDKWAELRPNCSFPHIAKARVLTSWGWEARGSGFASDVTEKGGLLFRERLLQAKEALEAAEAVGPLDAAYYAQRITVEKALGGDGDLVRELVMASAKLAPEYEISIVAAAEFFLPRWHGSPGDAELLAADLFDQVDAPHRARAFEAVFRTVYLYDRETVWQGRFDPIKLKAAALYCLDVPDVRPDLWTLYSEVAWFLQDVEIARAAVACRELQGQDFKGETTQWAALAFSLARTGKPTWDEDHLRLPRIVSSHGVDYSPDGKMILFASQSNFGPPLLVVDPGTQQLVGGLGIPGDSRNRVAQFVGPELQRILLLNCQPNEEVNYVIVDPKNPNDSLTFQSYSGALSENPVMSADGAWLATIGQRREKQEVCLYDAKLGKLKTRIEVDQSTQVYFTPDQKKLVLGSFGRLRIYDFDGVEDDFRLADPGRNSHVVKIAGFAANGDLLVQLGVTTKTGTEYGWYFLNLQTNVRKLCLSTSAAGTSNVKINRDGKLLTYVTWGKLSGSQIVRVVDLETQKAVLEKEIWNLQVEDTAISPDHRQLVVTDGESIRFYDIPSSE